jgi:hypothetical protein
VWGGGNDVDNGPSEMDKNWKADTGFSDADTSAMVEAYRWVADKTYATFLERGKFAWNQFLNNNELPGGTSDCPHPWVTPGSCAVSLREFCSPSGPLHKRAMMYGLTGAL